MILYHAGDREIREPDIRRGRKNADFGWGFYLTPDRDSARRWARDNAVINTYELDVSGLRLRTFPRDADWFRYIIGNRSLRDSLPCDVVIGPVANDTIFDTFGVVGSGYLEPEDALRLLSIGPEYTQVAVKTPEAARRLRWIGSERAGRRNEDARKAEQDAYQEAFAAELMWVLSEKGRAARPQSCKGESKR